MAFSWMAFDSMFLLEIILASDMTEEFKLNSKDTVDDKEVLVSKMNKVCSYPDRQFITKYRPIIEQNLLKFYKTKVSEICKVLNIQGATHNERQIKMSKKVLSASLIQAYIGALLDISGMNAQINEFSKFSSTVAINMGETQTEDIPLYGFQEEAIINLKKHFITEDKSAGILVMPTGSGKSRTSISFLIQEMVSQGYQILWVAHRHMLIEQAADCFYRFAGLTKIYNPDIKNYRISCISGEHMSIRSVDKHEIIVASISSICRNKVHLKRILGSKVMVVVDECHHTFAPTYRDTIEFIGKFRKNMKLLGLTATPVRANDKDSIRLLQLFDNNIVYNISMSTLIANGILSEPKFKRIGTGEDFETEITFDEENLIRKYGELPETLVNKIASSNSRNEIILDEYIKNKDEYGKTLIFAMNVIHCRFLYQELVNRGVKCGLVYSGKEDNTKVINLFKDGKLDVLVNVNIMTEGSDVPDVQTIFLTRPTSSEGLLMQMIGRGMRGLQAKGTETVNIIDFHDKWSTFNRWLNPEWLIDEEINDDVESESLERKKSEYIEYEWSLCQDIYKSMCFKIAELGHLLAIPAGWYTLIDEDGEIRRMIVFEDQLGGIKEMMSEKLSWKNDISITPEQIIRRYFRGFCSRPSLRDIELLIDNVRTLEAPPHICTFKNRKSIDPYYVAEKAEQENLDVFTFGAKLFEENKTIKDLYEEKEKYIMEICKAKIYKDKNHIIGMKVEELPDELVPFDRTPAYNIEELVQEVKDLMFNGSFDGISSIEWTDKAYRAYYGIHYGINHSIKINAVLNSKDVPREVVKFVIYHELLHRDNMSHDTAFRVEEHKYPNYDEFEHFLFGHMQKFDILEW